MNTSLNIKTRRLLFSPTFVTLLLGIVAVLVLGGPSVQAQTTANDTVDSSVTIAVKGSVADPNGTVNVTGNVIISSRRVIDNTSTVTPALVLLDFDFSQLKGTSGSGKALKTYITGGNHADEIRPFQSADKVIVTIPYFDSSKDALSARTMLATATLNFDITTGKLTSASISVGNNVVTSAAVGSVTTAPIQ
ncbi:MAG TPA: hypothetical protein VFS90_24015 [Pyrinomonadaceae bacterium]|nr:hypothetical protein [Pyrinomonadaceae bacterium]